VTLIDEPISLGDFLYGYSHAITIERTQRTITTERVNAAIDHIQDLRGYRLHADMHETLRDQLFPALHKYEQRRAIRAQTPLPLFVTTGVIDYLWLCGQRSYAQAWHLCEYGDWLLRIAANIVVDNKLVVRAACDCARTALCYVPEGDDRPLHAIEVVEKWCDDKATSSQVRNAVDDADASRAAYAASDDSAADAAASASHAAAAAYATHYAHGNVDDIANIADAAARAAANAADAANAANAAHNYFSARKHHADLIRSRIPWSAVRDVIRDKEWRRLP